MNGTTVSGLDLDLMQSLFSQGNLQLLLQRDERPGQEEFATVWPHPAHPCWALAPPDLQSESSSTRSLHAGVYTADGPWTGQTGRPAAWTVQPQGILGKLSGFRFSVTSFTQRAKENIQKLSLNFVDFQLQVTSHFLFLMILQRTWS